MPTTFRKKKKKKIYSTISKKKYLPFDFDFPDILALTFPI